MIPKRDGRDRPKKPKSGFRRKRRQLERLAAATARIIMMYGPESPHVIGWK